MTTAIATTTATDTVRAMLASKGLDWEVATQDLVLASDTESCDSLAECRAVPARAVVRRDTGAILGVVGLDYEPVQNWQKLAPALPLIEAGGTLARAGTLRGGRKVWVEIDVKVEGEVLRGDVVKHRLLIASSHDGSMSLRIQDQLVRLVCTNGMTSVETGASVSLRHTATVHDRLAQMAQLVAAARMRFEGAMAQYRALASRRLSAVETVEYVRAVFAPPRTEARQLTDGAPTGERVANRVIELVETGRGSGIYGVRGTAWGAYNAVTQYLTHDRGNDADRRTDSLWFGNGASLNRKALDMALALARGEALR
jgi:phage/plasmid-like protein (TIGR03299 family)